MAASSRPELMHHSLTAASAFMRRVQRRWIGAVRSVWSPATPANRVSSTSPHGLLISQAVRPDRHLTRRQTRTSTYARRVRRCSTHGQQQQQQQQGCKRENGPPVHSWLVGHLVPEGTLPTEDTQRTSGPAAPTGSSPWFYRGVSSSRYTVHLFLGVRVRPALRYCV